MVVLKPGLPGNPIVGSPPVPGLYIRFRDGVVDVKDDEHIALMKASAGYRDGDFIAVEEETVDPFADERTSLEPEHIITEMKYGTPTGRQVTDKKPKMSPALKKFIESEAEKIAKQMLPDMVGEVLAAAKKQQVSEANTEASETTKVTTQEPTIGTSATSASTKTSPAKSAEGAKEKK